MSKVYPAVYAVLALAVSACSPMPTFTDVTTAMAGGPMSASTTIQARGRLEGVVRAPVVAAGGMNLVAKGGGHVLVAAEGTIVAAGGGNIVGNSGSNIVAAGGLNLETGGGPAIVAAGGLNYDLFAVDDLEDVPVQGATVFLRDPVTLALVPGVAPATTDAAGSFAFPDAPLDGTYLLEAVALAPDGDGFRLTALARGGGAGTDVSTASTLVAARAVAATEERKDGARRLDPGSVAEAVQVVLDALKRDRIEARQAAEGVRVRKTEKDARVAEDYGAQDFGALVKAAARLAGRKADAGEKLDRLARDIDAGDGGRAERDADESAGKKGDKKSGDDAQAQPKPGDAGPDAGGADVEAGERGDDPAADGSDAGDGGASGKGASAGKGASGGGASGAGGGTSARPTKPDKGSKGK